MPQLTAQRNATSSWRSFAECPCALGTLQPSTLGWLLWAIFIGLRLVRIVGAAIAYVSHGRHTLAMLPACPRHGMRPYDRARSHMRPCASAHLHRTQLHFDVASCRKRHAHARIQSYIFAAAPFAGGVGSWLATTYRSPHLAGQFVLATIGVLPCAFCPLPVARCRDRNLQHFRPSRYGASPFVGACIAPHELYCFQGRHRYRHRNHTQRRANSPAMVVGLRMSAPIRLVLIMLHGG